MCLLFVLFWACTLLQMRFKAWELFVSWLNKGLYNFFFLCYFATCTKDLHARLTSCSHEQTGATPSSSQRRKKEKNMEEFLCLFFNGLMTVMKNVMTPQNQWKENDLPFFHFKVENKKARTVKHNSDSDLSSFASTDHLNDHHKSCGPS